MGKTMNPNQKQFRAVILKKFPGLTYPMPVNAHPTRYVPRQLPELETYRGADGIDYEYHVMVIAGPYSGTGQARAQITAWKKSTKRSYGTDEYVEAFVEVAETVWNRIA